MSAELLREAAALMRERAEAATPGPWQMRYGFPAYVSGPGATVTINDLTGDMEIEDATHIASWHPAVALAVADWLDDVAANLEAADDEPLYDLDRFSIRFEDTTDGHALKVARAYLGRES